MKKFVLEIECETKAFKDLDGTTTPQSLNRELRNILVNLIGQNLTTSGPWLLYDQDNNLVGTAKIEDK